MSMHRSRGRWRRFALSVTLAALAASVMAVPAMGGTEIEQVRPESQRLDLQGTRAPVDIHELRDLFVRLSEPSVAEFVASQSVRPSPRAQQAQFRAVRGQQIDLRGQVEATGADIVSTLGVADNGFHVKANLLQAAELRSITGVTTVTAIALHTPSNADSVPFMGVPEVWASVGTGEGITIGIIDTGIDYYHANFGGSGDPNDYDADDPTIVESGTFPTTKIAGGYDFVGDDYDASGEVGSDEPSPDDDPLDCHGHGTHVAGTAAGAGVGDVGQGVAPGATLYALKVFGCGGSTAVTAEAIEWAMDPNQDGSIDDHLDVINMSLGSPWGHPDDPSAVASQNAVDAGVIVVASAGNSGDSPYVTGAPAVAPGAISVAASVDDGYAVHALAVTIDGGSEQLLEAGLAGFGPSLTDTGPVTGTVATTTPVNGCAAIDEDLTGLVALISRGACEFSTKVLEAQNAGAIAAIIYNNTGGDAVMDMGPGAVADQVTIPSMFISQNDGAELVAAVGGGSTVEATLSADIVIPKPELADTLAGFTSRGPGAGTSFKPDVAAPGFGIVSSDVGTGTGGASSSGTSMAAPHIAGLAALLRSQHPDLPVAGIKALIMNGSVDPSVDYPLARYGVGVARADIASALTSYATPAGVSFGRLNPSTSTTETRKVDVVNLADEERTFALSLVEHTTPDGVTISLEESSVTVPAGKTKHVTLKLQVDPAGMAPDDAFASQREIDGWLIADDGVDTLRVGYLASVDPASQVMLKANKKQGLWANNRSQTDGLIHGLALLNDEGELPTTGPSALDGFGLNSYPGYIEFGFATDEAWEALAVMEFDVYIDVDEDGEYDKIVVMADLGLLQGLDPLGVAAVGVFDPVAGTFPIRFYGDMDGHDRVAMAFTLASDILPAGDTSFDYMALAYDARTEAIDVATGSVDLQGIDGPGSYWTIPAGAKGSLGVPSGETLWLRPTDPVADQVAEVVVP